MTLRRLTATTLALGFGALALLAVVVGTLYVQLNRHQAALTELIAVDDRIDAFSATSDKLALRAASDEELAAYRSQADAIAAQLRSAGDGSATERALAALSQLRRRVESIQTAERVPGPAIQLDRGEPISPTITSYARMSGVADLGVSLDQAISELIDAHQARIQSQINRLTASLLAAVAVLALLGVSALGLIRRRLIGPLQALETTSDRVLDGDREARLPIQGRDELAKLGATFNAILDKCQHDEAVVALQKRTLEDREAMLAESQRIATIGSWRYWPDTGELRWSAQTYLILGLDPNTDTADIEAFEARIHEADRDHVRRALQAASATGADHDCEYRVIRPDGTLRHVRGQAAVRTDADSGTRLLAGTIQDVTDAKAAETERNRLRERLSAILESVTDAVISLDGDWRLAYVNAEAARLLGLSTQDNGDQTLWQAAPALTGNQVQNRLEHAMDQRQTVAIEEQLDSLNRWLDIRVYPSQEGLTLLFRDTSEHHWMLNRVMDQEVRLTAAHDELQQTLHSRQALINSLPAHVALLDSEGTILDVNQQWCDYGDTGGNTDPAFSVGRNYIAVCEAASGDDDEGASEVAEGLRAILRGDADHFDREYPCHAPTAYQWFRVSAQRVNTSASAADTTGLGAVVMHIDITERKRAELALNRIAYEDALTGATSRQGFVETVGEQLAASGWQPHARVVMLDLHHHHDINDTYGFEAGDAVLQEVTRRLVANTPDDAVIGRSGGDEFVVFLPARTATEADAACTGITTSFAKHFTVGESQLDRRARFGYTTLDDTPRDPEQLVREAEMALFYANAGRSLDSWALYTTELDEQSRQRVQITEELRRALANDEFELHFQPKVSLHTGELVAAEALLRWWHPERGLQSPGLFIPIAEQSQLIGPLGNWVLNDACRRLRAWQDEGLDLVRLSVNVSVVQFDEGDFPRTVEKALHDNGIDPSALTLEITESVFEQNAESLKRQLHELHAMGIRLSMDDFGTGYSSLLYLQEYPFDEIKIDKGFVMKLQSQPFNARVVASVIGIAEALGAEVVAEGVESTDIADALLAMGCYVGQGFYYSMPLAPEDFHWLLQARHPLPLGRSTAASASNTATGKPNER